MKCDNYQEYFTHNDTGLQKWSGCSGFGQTSFSQGNNEIQFLQKTSNKQKC